MKVHAIGIAHLTGISSKSGKHFDFAQLYALRPLDVISGERFQKVGYGFEITELAVSPSAVSSFARVPFPCDLELTTDTQPGQRGFETVITGFRPVQVQKVA